MKLVALVLLFSAFSSLALTEVVDSFTTVCPEFFIWDPTKQQPAIPTVFSEPQYKRICQRHENMYQFATVYDTENRIPVYSAYSFITFGKRREDDYWKIEPQLEENIEEYTNKTEMVVSPRDEAAKNQIFKQAVNEDYADASKTFTRGHLYPHLFTADKLQSDSTFTLTNIAPQTQQSNQRWAEQVEQPMRKEIKQICSLDQNHPAYIVTGVVPGNNYIPIQRAQTIIKGVNVPSHYWSAYCCTNAKAPKQLLAKGYISDQNTVTGPVIYDDIADMSEELSKLYNNKTIKVFPGIKD